MSQTISSQVEIFIPCFVDQLYPQSAFNMVKVLKALGCEVNYNTNQTCCGQPAFNAGFWDDAKMVAEKLLTEMDGGKSQVVVMSSSCTGMIKNYYSSMLFENSIHQKGAKSLQARTHEFSDFVYKNLDYTRIRPIFNHKVTYHDACSALRECGIKSGPRILLNHVQGLELVEMAHTDTCCGFGGTFAVKFEPIATGMTEQKVQNALDTGAEYIVSADWSCLMEIDAYIQKHNIPLKVIHIADILAQGW
jgi:L-lactate dehydrogenase complex protein LldE